MFLSPSFVRSVGKGMVLTVAAILFQSCTVSSPTSFFNATKTSPSPTVIPSPPLTITYRQPYMGFTLQLPSSWEGHYQEEVPLQDPTTGQFDTVFINYLPTEGKPAMLIGITRVGEEAWQQLNQDPGFLATELGKRDGVIYYAQTSPTNPYPSPDTQRYQQFSLDVPRVLETFKFIPEASFVPPS